ncbi:hypothetical protein PV646_36795 [Streptomyces sp. ID05-26A]|nr:hypothetical protein [Streptomyces sp. ID05-26A]
MSGTDRHVSLQELVLAFGREAGEDQRVAAETAYAIAFIYRSRDIDGRRRFDLAKVWALRCIELLDSQPSIAINDVASTRMQVGEIPIPGLFHSGIVRHRLADVLV